MFGKSLAIFRFFVVDLVNFLYVCLNIDSSLFFKLKSCLFKILSNISVDVEIIFLFFCCFASYLFMDAFDSSACNCSPMFISETCNLCAVWC